MTVHRAAAVGGRGTALAEALDNAGVCLLYTSITFRDGHIARWRPCLRFVMWNVVSLGVSEVMIGLLTHFGLNLSLIHISLAGMQPRR